MAESFHDLNINEQYYDIKDVYRYRLNSTPYTCTYLRKYERECRDFAKVCGGSELYEEPSANGLKIQYKLSYNIMSFNNSIISNVVGGSGCGMYIRISGVNASGEVEACEGASVSLSAVASFFDSYTNCDTCGSISGLINFSGESFKKTYEKMRQDSGVKMVTAVEQRILSQDEIIEYNGGWFIDSLSGSCSFSKSGQTTVNCQIHYVRFEEMFGEGGYEEYDFKTC